MDSKGMDEQLISKEYLEELEAGGKGLVVTIQPYPDMRPSDVIQLYWGGPSAQRNKLSVAIARADSLDLSNEVSIDGSATLEVKYL